jgi:large exoprotein involved in heme utilization and adhesion
VETGIFADSGLQFDTVIGQIPDDGHGGTGGNIHVAADTLDIRNGGLISTKTERSGHGGDAVVDVGILTIEGNNQSKSTGIVADSATNLSLDLPAQLVGAGGSVRVTADRAYLTAGGQISATTATQGKGGDVFVQAHELVLDGHTGVFVSSISANSDAGVGVGGAGGTVTVLADWLEISNRAQISAFTAGLGAGGSIHVQAQTALITGAPGDINTGIIATSTSPDLPGPGGTIQANFNQLDVVGTGSIAGNTFGPGRGGKVFVTADTARLLQGGRISADTADLGTGGSVAVSAGSLEISGPGGIFSSSSAVGKGGPAGDVKVEASSAKLAEGGMISAASSSSGLGGSVLVNADRLTLSSASVIQASATGAGNAGSVTLNVTQPLELRDFSAIRVTSALSEAGTATINSESDVDLLRNSTITVQALTDNAGSIIITTTHRLLLQNSQLIAEAGINGGNIFVDPEYIILDHGRISANAVNTGGNILLTADNFLPSETPVTATGSTAGTVQVTAPPLDLSGALAALSTQLIDASIRFQERCAMRLGGEVSSFLVLGRAGTEDGPADPPVIISLSPLPQSAIPQQPARKK